MSVFYFLPSSTFLILITHIAAYVEQEVTIGGDVTLPCTVHFSGSPQVMWLSPHHEPLTRNDHVITADKRFSVDHPYQSEWNLEISGVKMDDRGNYTCMISSTPVQKKIVHLRIVSAPTITRSSDDVEVNTGSDVTIHCEAEGTPPPIISWYRYTYIGHRQVAPIITLPHHRISQEEDRDTFLQCSITTNPFVDVHWEHDGMVITESDKYQVTIQETGHYNKKWQSGHVRLIWPPEDAISNDGLSVIINCTVEQMNHRDSIAWWHYDRQLGYVRLFESHPAISKRPPVYLNMDKYMIVGHYNLIVKNVSLADGGEYMCELIGRGNHSAYITVGDQLVCQQGTNTSVIYEGGFASLACGMDFSGPIRLWNSVWKRHNLTLSSVDEDLDEYIRRTVTFPAYSKDSGLYTCVISNKKPPYYSQCDIVIEVIGEEVSFSKQSLFQ
ncbi:hypothetical protein LSH36_485g01012 [Paralvinella palmiformis]|uniref:Ig-like domain-containing protein n=1 Tax=Paralvinella palmiformis TaxID=53620 RepID=A0AAD9J9K9_9ANNE|nr:hypothetical protein LSH36_485g01012 [Paralvinella palmiformis]